MKKLFFVALLIACSGCGGGPDRDPTCENADEKLFSAVADYCESTSCCFCECFREMRYVWNLNPCECSLYRIESLCDSPSWSWDPWMESEYNCFYDPDCVSNFIRDHGGTMCGV